MPLKIGLVSPYDFSYPGGVNNHIKYLASNFVKWGHDVKILAPQSQPNKDSNLPIIPVGHPFPLSGLGTVSRIPVSPWLPLKVKNTIRKEKFERAAHTRTAASHITAQRIAFIELYQYRYIPCISWKSKILSIY